MALAEAIVLTFEDRPDEADAAFHRAQASFQRYRLPLDEADLLHCWGLVHSPAPEPDRPPPSSSTPHSPSCAGMAPAHHGSTE